MLGFLVISSIIASSLAGFYIGKYKASQQQHNDSARHLTRNDNSTITSTPQYQYIPSSPSSSVTMTPTVTYTPTPQSYIYTFNLKDKSTGQLFTYTLHTYHSLYV